MAKGQKKSNREIKKPKKTATERAKSTAPVPALGAQRTPTKGGQKKR